MRFLHIGDCHLGGWRIPKLQELNLDSFRYVVDIAIKEKLDFVLVAGDLFDSAYPPIDIIRDTFSEFRKLKEANIPVFIIAGSHDYSVSGKSFLDVLEKAGFVKNVFSSEEIDGKIVLHPTIYRNVAIYGYPGRKSGLEVHDIERIKLKNSESNFKILMLHTTLRDAIGTLPIPAVDQRNLPKVDYVALAHLHLNYQKENRIYCGPTFPNNASELEDLKGGSFFIVDTNGEAKRHEIKLRDVICVSMELKDAHSATEEIISKIEKEDIQGKILILKLKGVLDKGRKSDIHMLRIEKFAFSKGAYVVLKNTSKIQESESKIDFEIKSDNIEEEIISKFQSENPTKFNSLIHSLIYSLQIEKKEDETQKVFEDRLLSEAFKLIDHEIKEIKTT